MDAATSLEARCKTHAPKAPAEIAAAARRLSADGFSDHTVAAILKLDVIVVRSIVGERRA